MGASKIKTTVEPRLNSPMEKGGKLRTGSNYACRLDTFFRQIKSFRRFRLAFSFGLQTYYLIDFSKVYRLKGLKPKNKG